MNIETLSAITTFVTVMFAFVLIYYRWQQYVIDTTRQQLFELRDEVFDKATLGEIDRDHESYRVIRGMFNASIRFAHNMNIVHMTMMIPLLRSLDYEPFISSSKRVQQVLDSVHEEDRRIYLVHVLRQMQAILALHFVRVSPISFILLMMAILFTQGLKSLWRLREKIGTVLNGIAYTEAEKYTITPNTSQ